MKLNEIIKTKNFTEFESIDRAEFTPFEEKELKPREALEKLPKSHPVWFAFLELKELGHADKFPECYKVVDTGSYITIKIRGKDVEDWKATAKAKKGETVYKTEIALRKYKTDPLETKIAERILEESKVSNSWVGGKSTHKPL